MTFTLNKLIYFAAVSKLSKIFILCLSHHPNLFGSAKVRTISYKLKIYFLFFRQLFLWTAPAFFGVQKYVTLHIPPNLFQPFFNPFNTLTSSEVRPFFNWECKCRSTCLNNQIFFRNFCNFLIDFCWSVLRTAPFS